MSNVALYGIGAIAAAIFLLGRKSAGEGGTNLNVPFFPEIAGGYAQPEAGVQQPSVSPQGETIFSKIFGTPFGESQEPLTKKGYVGERPVFSGGQSGHTNVFASSLPEKYIIDAGKKGVTLVSKLPGTQDFSKQGGGNYSGEIQATGRATGRTNVYYDLKGKSGEFLFGGSTSEGFAAAQDWTLKFAESKGFSKDQLIATELNAKKVSYQVR